MACNLFYGVHNSSNKSRAPPQQWYTTCETRILIFESTRIQKLLVRYKVIYCPYEPQMSVQTCTQPPEGILIYYRRDGVVAFIWAVGDTLEQITGHSIDKTKLNIYRIFTGFWYMVGARVLRANLKQAISALPFPPASWLRPYDNFHS